jgi:hypothetical protein
MHPMKPQAFAAGAIIVKTAQGWSETRARSRTKILLTGSELLFMICTKALRWRTPLSASLKPAQTLPGDGSFAGLKAALGKKADVEVLVIGAGTAPHDVTKKFSKFSPQTQS